MKKIVEVTDLKKSYHDVQAVKGIDFYVEQGKFFAFLGPNGAGKSTTIDILCTLLKGDAGTVLINGQVLGREDVRIREEIGVVFQDHVLDDLLTVRENLYIRGRFYHLSKKDLDQAVNKAANETGLADIIDRPYGQLSGGQKRRADIARALVHSPQLLFLDEPTTGLDPQTRKGIWDTVRRLQKKSGITVFLTTHYLEEAADANYIIIIDDGLVAARGTPEEIKRQYSSNILKMKTTEIHQMRHILETNFWPYTLTNDIFTLRITDTMQAIPILEQCKRYISNVRILGATIEDAFLGITGKEIRE